MGKCIHAKFNGIWDDESKTQLGHMRISVSPKTITDGSVQQKLSIAIASSSKPVVVSIVGSGYFATSFAGLSDPSEQKTEYTISNSGVFSDLWFSVGTYDIDLSNKYNIWGIKMSESGISAQVLPIFDIGSTELRYLTALTRLYVNRNNSDIDISDLSDKSWHTMNILSSISGNLSGISQNLDNLVSLRVQDSSDKITGDIISLASAENCTYMNISGNSGIIGNIASLGTCKLLDTLGIYSSNGITGTLESLAEAMIAAGRTSGTLNVDMNNVVTVNGQTVQTGTRKTITFSGGTYVIN